MNGQAMAMPAAMDRPADDEPSVRIAALFDAHHQRLYRLARRMARTAEDAHDVVQETFLRAARSPASIPHGPSHEEAWLVRVLINICRDRWRHTAVRTRAAAEGHVRAAAAVSPEAGLLAKAMVQQALATLPPRRRAILVMHELEGTTIPSIAPSKSNCWNSSSRRRAAAATPRGRSSTPASAWTVGETVVVGTSRIQGEKALIALLTAVPPKSSVGR